MTVEEDDFVRGVVAGVRQVPRSVKEDAYVEWFEDMDAETVDYYVLGNIFGYEAIHGGIFDRLLQDEIED